MNTHEVLSLSRRDFNLGGLVAGIGVLTSWGCRRERGQIATRPTTESPFAKAFNFREAQTLEAFFARLLPESAEQATSHARRWPGAYEAGVLSYLDANLTNADFANARASLAYGANALEVTALRRHSSSFAALSDDKKDELIAALATDQLPVGTGAPTQPIFKLALALLLEGLLGDPKYGGNTGGVGWQAAGWKEACHH